MKKILFVMCSMFLFFLCPTHADAKTGDVYYALRTDSEYYVEFTLSSDTQIPIAYYDYASGKVNCVRYAIYDTAATSSSTKTYQGYLIDDYGNRTDNPKLRTNDLNGIAGYKTTSEYFWNNGNKMETNMPLFNTFEDAKNYLLTGSTDGWLNKPEYDLTIEHDFNSDIWTPDIPVPELSQISHTGFTLDNWTEEYYVDIIVDNHLSRIMMGKRYPSNDVTPLIIDSDPWYSEHYWNFTLHDVIPSRSVIDINEIFGVDIQGALIEDFKNWSIEHPDIKTIDRYNWTHMGQADEYLAKHVYKTDSELSDVEQLKNSGQAITEYYVRYFTLDGQYGQWGHYKLRDFSYNGQGERVDSGRVTAGTIDNSGKPSNTVTGSTDTNGNIDYTPIVDTNVDVNIGELTDVLNSFAGGVGQLPALIGQVFTFLPWWITAMIAGIIAICITLRVLGR